MAGPSAAAIPRVLAHYGRSAALLERAFAGTPIVFADFPRGFRAMPRMRVTHITLSAERIGWLVQREYAIEFHTWAPMPGSPDRLQFGRIAVEPNAREGFRGVKEIALATRDELLSAGYDANPVLDGVGGVVLWLPFTESPTAAKIRLKLERICARVAVRRKARLDASINAPGHYSPLPYSLRGTPGLPVCAPVTWAELERLRAPVVCSAETFPPRFARVGDLFARGVEALALQRLRMARHRNGTARA